MTSRAGQQREEDNIEWRRDKVRELSSKSLSVSEIATILKIPKSTIHSDIIYLRTLAKENINKYVDETLVHEFDKINTGLEQIVKNSWQRYESANTDKEKYMYLSLAKETYQVKAALLDSGTIIDKAIRFVTSHNRDRGLTNQNDNPLIDTNTEQAQQQDNDKLTES